MSSQAKKDQAINEFMSITNVSRTEATKIMKKYNYRVEHAIDAFYSGPPGHYSSSTPQAPAVSPTKIGELYDKYKDRSAGIINVEGTIKLCEDLDLGMEDVALLALAYELKSPRMGEWPRQEFIDRLKLARVDSIDGLRKFVGELRTSLKTDPDYFRKVYSFTFKFGLNPGQRSLGVDMAVPFWEILLPAALAGNAIKHEDGSPGWNEQHTAWWFEFLTSKNVKGISKDTWNMFLDFIKTIDPQFQKHDAEAAWPSQIDDFVEYAKDRAAMTE